MVQRTRSWSSDTPAAVVATMTTRPGASEVKVAKPLIFSLSGISEWYFTTCMPSTPVPIPIPTPAPAPSAPAISCIIPQATATDS